MSTDHVADASAEAVAVMFDLLLKAGDLYARCMVSHKLLPVITSQQSAKLLDAIRQEHAAVARYLDCAEKALAA